MLVSGFTVIRNAEIMGYPVVQSIKSILPLVDEFVVGVGQSDDNTKGLIASIGSSKIKIFDSFWDTNKTVGGLILSEKTNEALARCQGTWCFYLQADEVVHEDDLQAVRAAMERHANDDKVEGLLFQYLHFYGSYGIIATARNWYRNEVRVIKKSAGARSHGDAQGFRVGERKPHVKSSGGRIFHYGWVKPPKAMGQKNKFMSRWWHGDKLDNAFNDFQFRSGYGLKLFKGTHPSVMAPLVTSQNWDFRPDQSPAHWNLKDVKNFMSDIVEKATGHRFGEHKNYVLLK